MKKLSIIVPIYNVELYLKECIDSILAQSYEDLEIILVDDGSTDSSPMICDDYVGKHPNIIVIHQENRGLPFARNAGLDIATGEYVGFVDSDDVVDKDMFKKLVYLLEISAADVCACNFEVFNKKGTVAISQKYRHMMCNFSNDSADLFYKCALDSSCNKIYVRRIIEENRLRFEDKQFVAQEDFWFLIRYFSYIEKMVTTAEPLYKYRERGSSISRGGSDKDITSRCIRFVELAAGYMDGVGRKSNSFLSYMTLEMMSASINQLPSPTKKNICDVVKQFSKLPYYKESITRKKVIKGGRDIYDAMCMFFLRNGLNGLFSFFESLRVKRLRSTAKLSDRFE